MTYTIKRWQALVLLVGTLALLGMLLWSTNHSVTRSNQLTNTIVSVCNVPGSGCQAPV